MTRIITDPRHQRGLAREFGIRQGFVAPEVEPTIQPVAIVADLEHSDAYSDAPFVRRCHGTLASTGGGATFGQVWLSNPPASPVHVVIRRIYVSGESQGATIECGLVLSAAAPAAVTSQRGSFFNRRLSTVADDSAAQVNQSGVAAAPLIRRLFVAAGDAVGGAPINGVVDEPGCVLTPGGDVVLCRNTITGFNLSVTFWWDEIPRGQS